MKKVFRSRRDKVLGGVCGGLGIYFDIDPVLIRIIFVLSGLFHGFGVIAYIILWIIIPDEPLVFPGFNTADQTDTENSSGSPENTAPSQNPIPHSSDSGRMVAGIFLIILGLLFLSHRFFYFFHIRDILPFGLLLLGIILLVNSFRR